MRRGIWLLLFTLLLVLGCNTGDRPGAFAHASEKTETTASALTNIDVRAGASPTGSFGRDDGSVATVGQVITVPANEAVLTGFGFLLDVPSTVVFRGLVYAWSGDRATGSSLFESAPRSAAGAGPELVAFDTGSLALTPGAQYVLFATASKDAGTGSGSWYRRSDNPYAGGRLVLSGTPSDWTSNGWTSAAADDDIGFTATFDKLASSTTLVSSSNPSVSGQSVTLTATVAGPAATPAGNVVFKDGASVLGAATLNGAGQASLAVSGLDIGSRSITAEYGGSAVYLPSTSASLTQVVGKAGSLTALTSSINPSTIGGSVTFTASVTAAGPGSGVPAGTVTFRDGATTLGTATVDAGGIARFSTSGLALGSHSVVAEYGGSARFDGSTSPAVTQVVAQAATTVGVTSSSNPSTYGTSVTFTATVSSMGAFGTPTGTVTFKDGATTLGTRTLNASGVATFSTATLAGGGRAISAVYSGDANHATASGSLMQFVIAAASTTTVASATNPSLRGQPVTLTATVSGPGGTPTGTVTFYDGATAIGSASLNGAGQASVSVGSLPVGAHAITAAYGGDTNFGSSSSTGTSQQVVRANTTTTLTSSSNPAIVGATITLTAHVVPIAPGAGAPTGTVTFRRGATVLGTGTVGASGLATFATSSLTVGTHTIVAEYPGDDGFIASTSTSLAQVVNQDGVSTTLASSLNPSTFGASVTFTATVASVGPGGLPTGTITFYDGATTLGTGTLDGAGVATFTTAGLTGGTHAIGATYGGDATHAPGSSATLTQVVTVASTATEVASSATPSVFGQVVTFTATVTSTAAGTPKGTVTFSDGVTTLGTAALGANGNATLTTSVLAVATHPISAAYSGDTSYAASTSAALAQIVEKASTSTIIASSSNPSLVGATVTLTATVTATAPGAGIPSGTVTFKDGATTLGTGALSADGVATFDTADLEVGDHPITAEYTGDSSFVGSTSSALAQKVSSMAATIVVTATPSPSKFGAAISFTATLTGEGATPSGTVTLKDGTTALGTGALDASGVVSISVPSLAAGTHTITAEYSGDDVYASGTGTVSHVVEKAATTTTLASSRSPSIAGDAVTFTASVSSAIGSGLAGEIELFDGVTSLGKAAIKDGKATFTTTALTQGGHSMTARYGGNASFAASTSTALTQTVNAAAGSNTDAGTGSDSGDPSLSTGGGGGCAQKAPSSPATGDAASLFVFVAAVVLGARRRRR